KVERHARSFRRRHQRVGKRLAGLMNIEVQNIAMREPALVAAQRRTPGDKDLRLQLVVLAAASARSGPIQKTVRVQQELGIIRASPQGLTLCCNLSKAGGRPSSPEKFSRIVIQANSHRSDA